MKTRHTFTATLLVALLAIAGVTAAIAADPADPPPPRIAFVANGRVPADALAAGPIAGQLGAPVYTTEQHVLPDSTADALDDYNPELVIVMGGSVAISDDVVNAIAAATGLPAVDPTPPPTTGVVRAAGADRFVTATVVADLLSAYDPAYLGVDLQAVDADLLDGLDSSAFMPAERPAAYDVMVALSSPADDTATSVGQADLSLPDQCGGADNWTIRATASGYYLPSPGADGSASISLALDDASAHNLANILNENIGSNFVTQDRTIFSNTWLFEDVDAGNHSIHAIASETTDGTVQLANGRLIVEVVGFSC